MNNHALVDNLRADIQAICGLLGNLARDYPQQLQSLSSYVFFDSSESALSFITSSSSGIFNDLALRFSTLSDDEILQYYGVFSSPVINPQQCSQIAPSLLSSAKLPFLKAIVHIRLLKDLLIRAREMNALFRLIAASGVYSLSPSSPGVDESLLFKISLPSPSSSAASPSLLGHRMTDDQLIRALESLQACVRQLSYARLTDLRNDPVISDLNSPQQDRLSQLAPFIPASGDCVDFSPLLLTLVSGISADDMFLCDSAFHDFCSVQLFQVVKLQAASSVALYELQNILGVTPASFNVEKFESGDHGSPTMPFMLSPEQEVCEVGSTGVLGLSETMRELPYMDETVLNSDPMTLGQYTDKISLFGTARNDSLYVSPQVITSGQETNEQQQEEMSDGGDFFGFEQNLRSDDSSTDSHSTAEDHHSPEQPNSVSIPPVEAGTSAPMSDNCDESAILQIVEQPPDMCVYRRNIRPIPSVRICCSSFDDQGSFCVVPMMYRCDTNNNETKHLSGREFSPALPGSVIEFKKLRILMTSRMLSDSLLILVFELRRYKRINPVNSFLALTAPPPTSKKADSHVLSDLKGIMIPVNGGSLRAVTLEDLDNPQEYEVVHSVISSPITVVSHSTQLRSSDSSKRDSGGSSVSGSPSPIAPFLQGSEHDFCSVSEIIPNSGPSGGGTRVAILGSNFSNTTSIRVCFGEVEVVPTVLGQRTLVCMTPPHQPGVVTIRVKTEDMPFCSSPCPMFTYE